MRWTRFSFGYLITYLTTGGLGLLFAPDLALRLLLATGRYPDVPMRLVGGLMLALALLVLQIVRLRVEALYTSTLGVRAMLLAVLAWLHARSGDRLFLVLGGIVALGMIFTGLGYVTDRRAHAGGTAAPPAARA
jgi:uncharacterized protein YjeT (DUF2065 family)